MPEPPPYDPATQYLDTTIDINGVAAYEVRDKTQEETENDEDFARLKDFMDTPRAELTLLPTVRVTKSLIRILYRMTKVD